MPVSPEPDPEPWLERWIGSFRGPLIGLLASWGSDWRTAEELAQDVFAEAWVGRERFGGDAADLEAVGAWLRGIAFHLFRGQQRRAERRGTAELARDLAAPIAEEDERRAQLTAAFAHLSTAHQTVLRMHYLEETSAREVAALLEITPKAVEDRLYQARRALRELVEQAARASETGVRT